MAYQYIFSSTPKFKGYQRPAVKATPAKGIDIDAVGSINGTPIYDFDITKLDTEEKPWRKPGSLYLLIAVRSHVDDFRFKHLQHDPTG